MENILTEEVSVAEEMVSAIDRKYSYRGYKFRRRNHRRVQRNLKSSLDYRTNNSVHPVVVKPKKDGEVYFESKREPAKKVHKKIARRQHRRLNVDYCGKVGSSILKKEYDLWWELG